MTEKQEDEDGAETAQIFDISKGVTDMGGILDDGRLDVQAPAFIKLLVCLYQLASKNIKTVLRSF